MKYKKLLNFIVNTVLAAVVLFTVLTLVSSHLSSNGKNMFGLEVYTVLSGSMEPEIKTGSIIFAKSVTENKDRFKAGDIITYKSMDDPNKLITHRIVEVEKINNQVQYVTKGDNNDALDSVPIQADQIVALYFNLTIPLLGYLITFAKSTLGIVLILLIPGFCLVLFHLIKIWKIISGLESDKGKP